MPSPGNAFTKLRACLLAWTLLILSGCADQLILGENHEQVDPGGAKPFVIHKDGKAIECWRALSPGAAKQGQPQAYVLFFGGKADRTERWINMVAVAWGEHPVEVWGMNYPGSGGSDGPARLADVSPAAMAVYDHLRELAVHQPIFIHAGSFGTAVAIDVAAHRDVAGMIIQNPPPLRQLINENYGWWNLGLLAGQVASQVPDELDSIANGARCRMPAVFISAEQDQIVPAKFHRMVIDAYAGPKQIISMPWAGHDSPLPAEAAAALTKDMEWLWNIPIFISFSPFI